MELLVFINLIWSCKSTFDCRTFWPTLSYMGCYKGHDRVYNMSAGFFSIVLMTFFISASLNYAPYISKITNQIMVFLGLGISMLFPAVTIIDEANSSYYVQTELVHYILMCILVSLSFAWVYFSVIAMRRVQLDAEEDDWNSFLKKYILLGACMAGFSIYQWKHARSEASNWLINENVEALSEWFTVTLCIFAPFFYSLTFPSFSLTVSGVHSNTEHE